MPDIQITNQLPFEISIYDSFSGSDAQPGLSADASYFGHLTLMGTVAANSSANLTLLHNYVAALIAFDNQQAPLARQTWILPFPGQSAAAGFVVGAADVSAMQLSKTFVEDLVQNPGSALAKSFAQAKDQGVVSVDAFFKSNSAYNICTFATYMLALTYLAQTPPSKALPPPQKQYSLSHLVSSLGGIPYPTGLPDILLDNFYCRFTHSTLMLGGTLELKNLPFENEQIAGNVLSLFPITQVQAQLRLNVQLGLNLLGTQIAFLANNFTIPVGNDKTIVIDRPEVTIDINPLFKFVVFGAAAVIPFSVFDQKFDAKISMTIDNVEAAINALVSGLNGPLLTPPILKGVHLDQFGIGMGVMFEPPGYALGLQGALHIGSGSSQVALDDDQFALVCELEGDVPNPVYLSFYVPKLDLATLLSVFTNVSNTLDFPVDIEELAFIWNEDPMQPVALPDGSLSQGGYGFSGYLNLFGLRFYTKATLSLAEIKGMAVLAPLSMGELLSIGGNSEAVTAKIDANGNPIRNNQIAQTAAMKAVIANASTKTLIPAGGAQLRLDSTTSPWLSASIQVSFLELVHEQLEASVDKRGISFELDYGAVLSTKLSCSLQDFHNFSASFSYGPDFTISLPSLFGFSLGSIHLVDTINAGLVINTSASSVLFQCSGGFDFEGVSHEFGPFNLDVNITRISDLLRAIEQAIAADAAHIFGAVVQDAKQWATWVKSNVVQGAIDVVGGLKVAYQKTVQEAADILHDVGYDADYIASGLHEIYSADGVVIGGILKGYGYTAQGVAIVFNKIGFGATDAAHAIAGVFDTMPEDLNKVLQGAGYAANQVKDAFDSLGGDFSSAANVVASGTSSVANTIAKGITNAAITVGNGVVTAAKTVGNGVVTAAKTVANAFKSAGSTIAGWFHW